MSETKLWAIFVVLFCTLFTSTAQILLKTGINNFNLSSLLTNYTLIGGLVIYALGAVLLIISFKGGEVTVIYPVFATSYIWVLLLSVFFLDEAFTFYKIASILLIITGIFFVTKGGRKMYSEAEPID